MKLKSGKFKKPTKNLFITFIKSLKKLKRPKNPCKILKYILNTFLGFFGGIVLTYFLFLFLIFQLNFGLTAACITGTILGFILTLGLSFSFNVRCIVFLILPQFFSKKGRAALVAYAYLLTFTGPAANTIRNTKVIVSTLSCGQDQLSDALKNLLEIIKQPFVAIKNALKHILSVIEKVLLKVKVALMNIQELMAKICKNFFYCTKLAICVEQCFLVNNNITL